jgi:hypothetical protein
MAQELAASQIAPSALPPSGPPHRSIGAKVVGWMSARQRASYGNGGAKGRRASKGLVGPV